MAENTDKTELDEAEEIATEAWKDADDAISEVDKLGEPELPEETKNETGN